MLVECFMGDAMALEFVDQEGVFNENTQAVRFFGLDGEASIMFTVSRDALEGLAGVEDMSSEELAASFGHFHRTIQAVAAADYRRLPHGGVGASRLDMNHFVEYLSPVKLGRRPWWYSGQQDLFLIAAIRNDDDVVVAVRRSVPLRLLHADEAEVDDCLSVLQSNRPYVARLVREAMNAQPEDVQVFIYDADEARDI